MSGSRVPALLRSMAAREGIDAATAEERASSAAETTIVSVVLLHGTMV